MRTLTALLILAMFLVGCTASTVPKEPEKQPAQDTSVDDIGQEIDQIGDLDQEFSDADFDQMSDDLENIDY